MKQRDRYALNDREAYDGRPVKDNSAKSSRTQPARIVAGGKVTRAAGRTSDVTAGITGQGGRRPAGNTMRNARMGGGRVHYFDAAEVDATPRPNVHAPARVANRRIIAGMEDQIRAAGQSEGLRQSAMQRHSVLRTTGAVDVKRGHGPVWLQETTQSDHMVYGPFATQQ